MRINWMVEEERKTIDECLRNLKEDEGITIYNVVSNSFIEAYDVEEPTDFNGWCCDWWSTMTFEGRKFGVMGEAFYGKVSLSLE